MDIIFHMTIIIIGSTALDTILLGFEMYFGRFYIFRSLDKTSLDPDLFQRYYSFRSLFQRYRTFFVILLKYLSQCLIDHGA